MNKFIKPISQYLQNNYKCNMAFKDTFTNVSNIFVIGDIHGDLSVLIKSLRKINIIDNNLNWKGGNSHIVQLGDILDGGGRGDNVKNLSTNAMEEFTIFEFFCRYNRFEKMLKYREEVILLCFLHIYLYLLILFYY